ncbi:LOB domain-containing protein 40-like protein [Carex littledalei]|uniref:LOB domain-containing protein 40-like protein n=1 Tax=Carex littledalei TaxID=544730 RepID=A0A833RRC6_9POAL|nr:LOB domain-containing protein 40-like protein [Carex littledalei]
MSCNGCRVLRKGCDKNCSIRPCLQWIESPESQAHATMFLAKFYGRTGLLNLINSGPDHLRPEIFRSLMYEACGRIVNPVYGSVGLVWSGSWPMVEAAVEAVLNGQPIVPIPSNVSHPTYDIRHLSKTGTDSELHIVSKTMRTRFKRTAKANKVAHRLQIKPEYETAHEPELSHKSSNESPIEPTSDRTQREVSVDTVDAASDVSQGEPGPVVECEDVGLDLTLGFGCQPASQTGDPGRFKPTKIYPSSSSESTYACSLSLELQLSA